MASDTRRRPAGGAPPLLRALRRSPRFAGSILVVLALGTGTAAAVLSLSAGGLRHPSPVESPQGVDVPSVRAGGYAERSALEQLFGAGAGLGGARRSIAEIQRSSLDDLLRTTGAAALLALALACLNAGLLLLARAGVRRPEIAIRSVLGATRARLLRLLLAEAAWLAAAGACLGLILGAAGVAMLRRSWPPGLREWLAGGVPPGAVALAVALPLLTAVLCGMAPLAAARERGLRARLGSGGRSTASRHEGFLRRQLTIAAVASSLTLLTGAGLLLRGFAQRPDAPTLAADAGDTLTLSLAVPARSAATPAERAAFYEAVLERVAAVPGVEVGSVSSAGAWAGLGTEELVHAVYAPPAPGAVSPPGTVQAVRYLAVSPGYFRSMRVPLVRGRAFTPADRAGAPGVVVVSRTFAHRLFPGQEPVGRQVQLGGMSIEGEYHTVVGVVEDVRVPGLGMGSVPVPALYLSALQAPPSQAGLAVRAAGDPWALWPAVERALHQVDPSQPANDPMTLEQRLAALRAPLVWLAWVTAGLALLVALLAAFGLYGVISYSVAQRTRELGVRLALGAPAAGVVRMVVAEGVRLAATGMVWGLAGALCLGRLLQYLLNGVQPLDPVVHGAAVLLVGLVAVLASYGPARAAARVEPVVALRAE